MEVVMIVDYSPSEMEIESDFQELKYWQWVFEVRLV
jgi:hypothetical protein